MIRSPKLQFDFVLLLNPQRTAKKNVFDLSGKVAIIVGIGLLDKKAIEEERYNVLTE